MTRVPTIDVATSWLGHHLPGTAGFGQLDLATVNTEPHHHQRGLVAGPPVIGQDIGVAHVDELELAGAQRRGASPKGEEPPVVGQDRALRRPLELDIP